MSPIVVIVFAPVVVGGLALMALLLGAAATGAFEVIERRADESPTPPESGPSLC